MSLSVRHTCSDAATVPVSTLAGDVLVMFPQQPFHGVWDRMVDQPFPAGAPPGQVVVERELINAP